jgi:hypothetical protein
MLSGLRTIHIETSLRWPPIEGLGVTRDAVRRLYNRLFESVGHRYENLELQGSSPLLSTRHPGGGESICKFGDALTIVEKNTRVTVTDFLDIVKTVLGMLKEEEVPPFFIQQCKIQCLAQPNHSENSLILLARRVSRVYESVAPFGRPPSQFGVRFRFPAITLDEADNQTELQQTKTVDALIEHPRPEKTMKQNVLNVRFETYPKDISLVWMEVTAAYPLEQPLWLRDANKIAANIQESHEFLADKSMKFLGQFDHEEQE